MAMNQLRATFAAALPALVVLLLVSTDARAGCAKDTDCKGERICRAGECVDPDGPQSCEMDTDCPGEQICTNGACARQDTHDPAEDEATESTDRPAASTAAAAPRLPLGGCRNDAECIPEEECYGSTCRPRGEGDEEHRSTGAMIAGAVLLPAGFIPVMIGTIWAAVKPDRVDNHPESYVPLWAIGGAAMITGVVLLVIGAPKVKAQPETAANTVIVEPLIGPTGGGLRVRF